MTLVVLIAAGVVLGLFVFWGIFAGARAIASDNERVQAVLLFVALGVARLFFHN